MLDEKHDRSYLAAADTVARIVVFLSVVIIFLSLDATTLSIFGRGDRLN